MNKTVWYRKKPVEVRAYKFDGGTREEIVRNVPPWLFNAGGEWEMINGKDGRIKYIEIKTSEGVMMASIGDYIIKGVKGELYPCKPAIFEATYERVYR